MGHTVGDAAAKAVAKSERKAATEQTPQQLIDALRKNLATVPVGYVPTHQIVALLGRFDFVTDNLRTEKLTTVDLATQLVAAERAAKALEDEKKVMTDTILGLTQNVQELQAKNQEFRDVYEKENFRANVTLEKGKPADPELLNEDWQYATVPVDAVEKNDTFQSTPEVA
jgi:hypothetical protein